MSHCGVNCIPMIAIFTLSYLCNFATGQSALDRLIPITWNITDRYGQESYWLHSDSKLKLTLNVMINNVTGYMEFGYHMFRENDGSCSRRTIPNQYLSGSNFTYSFGPYPVEDFWDASTIFSVNVTITQPPPPDTSVQDFVFGYVLCLDEEDLCQNADSLCLSYDNMFCFRNSADCQSFAWSQGRLCRIHEQFSKTRACSERGATLPSLCYGYVSPNHLVRSILPKEDMDCGALEVFFVDQGTGMLIMPGSYRLRSDPLTIGCLASGDDFLKLKYLPVKIIERSVGGTVLFETNNGSCDGPIKLRKPGSFFSVTYLTISDADPGKWTTLSFVQLVNFMISKDHLKVKLCHKVLQCILTAPLPVPGSFRAHIVLFKYDQRSEFESQEVTYGYVSNYTMNITVEDYYVCLVKIRFRGCAPFTEFVQTEEIMFHVESLGKCAELHPVNIPAIGTTLLALIIITVLVLLALIGASATWFFIRWKVRQQKAAGVKPGVGISKVKKKMDDHIGQKGKPAKEKHIGKVDRKKPEKRGKHDGKTTTAASYIAHASLGATSAAASKAAKASEIKKAKVQSSKEKDRKSQNSHKSQEKHRYRSTSKKVPDSSPSQTTTTSSGK